MTQVPMPVQDAVLGDVHLNIVPGSYRKRSKASGRASVTERLVISRFAGQRVAVQGAGDLAGRGWDGVGVGPVFDGAGVEPWPHSSSFGDTLPDLPAVSQRAHFATAANAVFIGLGVGAFGLQLTGSWWLAVPLLLAGTLAFLSVGLLAGSIARTEEGAVGMANFVVLPMAFLSGSFFSLEAAPGWVRAIAEVLPLKWLNEGMLDVMVRGEGVAAAAVPVGALLAFALVLTVLASRLFRWDR